MKWPFVTRARFEDAQKQIAKLETERDALRENYERVTDEINFRATGFHLYPRFEKKLDVVTVAKQATDALNEKDDEAKPLEERYGPRIRNQVRGIEMENMVEFEQRRKSIVDLARLSAAAKLEAAMETADKQAQQA